MDGCSSNWTESTRRGRTRRLPGSAALELLDGGDQRASTVGTQHAHGVDERLLAAIVGGQTQADARACTATGPGRSTLGSAHEHASLLGLALEHVVVGLGELDAERLRLR